MADTTIAFYILDDGVEFSYSIRGNDELEFAQAYLRNELGHDAPAGDVGPAATTYAITAAQYTKFNAFMSERRGDVRDRPPKA